MDAPLPLPQLPSLLPLERPFTTAAARAAALDKRALNRLLHAGHLVRVLRGVYAASAAAHTRAFRHEAVRLALGARAAGAVVVDRTAGWLHGLPVELPVPLEVVRSRPGLVARDVRRTEGLAVTTPLRTALDLGRLLTEPQALAALDALIGLEGAGHVALLAELPRMARLVGAQQLRRLAVIADERADGEAESVLRLRWLQADLPTPIPGALVPGAGGHAVRLALALPERQFGAVLMGRLAHPDQIALAGAGWRVLTLPESRVLAPADPHPLTHHLLREFHQHLLDQVG